MSINKLSHLKEGEKIYIPLERILHLRDDTDGLCFHDVNGCTYWVTDDDTFYTLDDLKQLANDGMPKQGDIVEVYIECDDGHIKWDKQTVKHAHIYVETYYDGNKSCRFSSSKWRFPRKKTELTLAEVEEKLGLENGSLTIKE